MPYLCQKKGTLIPKEYDRRVKLTEEDKKNIRELRSSGMGIRAVARQYEHKCTRRVIQYTLRPELKLKLGKAFIERRKDGRYKPAKAAWAATMREHRAYKHKLYKEGKLADSK
jgi:hypothetical protein